MNIKELRDFINQVNASEKTEVFFERDGVRIILVVKGDYEYGSDAIEPLT